MTDLTHSTIESGLALFRKLIREDTALSHQLTLSRADFFRSPGQSADSGAELRHIEWFLVERYFDDHQCVMGEELLATFLERADGDMRSFALALQESVAGVYEVTEVNEVGAWLRDLASGVEYPLAEGARNVDLADGNLLIGRLYATKNGSYQSSPAVLCLRDPGVIDAVRADIEAARESRRGTPHLSQSTLEATFFPLPLEESSDNVDPSLVRVAAWLAKNSVDAGRCAALLSELRAAPFDDSMRLPGVEDALGRVLSDLAFHSDLDLEEARRLLLDAWSSMSTAGHARDEAHSLTDTREALAEFDRARAAGGDLDLLFDKLERDLGMDGPEVDQDVTPAPDFPGVVGAMVEEFIWEKSRASPKGSDDLGLLRKLSIFCAPIGVFEELGAEHLLEFSACWLLDRGNLDGPLEAQAILRVLGVFCRWADDNHGLDLGESFGSTLAILQESVPRLVEARRYLERKPSDPEPEFFEVTDVRSGVVHVGHASLTRRLEIPDVVGVNLRRGDWLRVETGEKSRVLGCYPPQAASVPSLGIMKGPVSRLTSGITRVEQRLS